MALLLRDLPAGDNATDSFIGGVHFNRTILDNWNYTLYGNQTLSNNSWCLLVFPPYTPVSVYPNGSFVNATWCYTALKPVGPRATTGVAVASLFGLLLLLVLFSLNKHGRLYLPAETRFRPIGRRWQWYWGILVCATALIGLFTGVDVDRYYVMELPIVLNVFFWFMMQLCAVALVWEAVRHWGSWKERQFIDPDPFSLRQDDKRAAFEFYAPLWFYLWFWLNFFMIVPRNWGPIEMQRSDEQTLRVAKPTATDTRFRAAAFMLFICWLTIVVHMWHSIRHYNPRNRGVLNRAWGCIRYIPARFVLIIPLALAIVAYQALAAFNFDLSPLNVKGSVPAIYVGGYLPALLILLIQCIYGLASPNEDRELLRQRRLRGDAIDQELGIVHKPAWWRRLNGEHLGGMRDRIARNVAEIGGGRATGRGVDRGIDNQAREAEQAASKEGGAIEMGALRRESSATTAAAPRPGQVDASRPGGGLGAYAGKSDRRRSERTLQGFAGVLFPNEEASRRAAERRAELTLDGPPSYADAERGRALNVPAAGRPGTADRSNSAETTGSITAPPQQVRSMLDV